MKQKMTRAERVAAANEMTGSRDAQRNLGRKQITVTVSRDKKASGRKTKR